MPRVVCPKCDKIVKISDQEDRTSVRCPKCSHNIRLMSARHVDEKTATRRKKRGAYDKFFRWIPVAIAVPLGVLLLLLSYSSEVAAAGAFVVGMFAFIGGMIWGAMQLSEDGGYVGFDYLNLFGSFRLVLLIFLVGLIPLVLLYLLGYVLFVLFTQVQFTFGRPKRYLPIVILEMFGMFAMVAGPILGVRGDHARTLRRAGDNVPVLMAAAATTRQTFTLPPIIS